MFRGLFGTDYWWLFISVIRHWLVKINLGSHLEWYFGSIFVSPEIYVLFLGKIRPGIYVLFL